MPLLRADNPRSLLGCAAGQGAARTEGSGGGEPDDGGYGEMKVQAQRRVEFIEFMITNYRPGIEITGYGDVYSCKTCGAVVLDTENALEQHVKWHEALITPGSTYINIMRTPQ